MKLFDAIKILRKGPTVFPIKHINNMAVFDEACYEQYCQYNKAYDVVSSHKVIFFILKIARIVI